MEKITAQQAAIIAKSKEQPIEDVLKMITQQAEYGERFMMCRYLNDEIMLELINLGYVISRHEDPFGIEQTRVRW